MSHQKHLAARRVRRIPSRANSATNPGAYRSSGPVTRAHNGSAMIAPLSRTPRGECDQPNRIMLTFPPPTHAATTSGFTNLIGIIPRST